MKIQLTALLSVIVLAGCFTPKDPVAHFYQPYQGKQQNWPTSEGGFVSTFKGVTIYHGVPPMPYTIIGRYSHPNLRPDELAGAARFHHADAVLLSEQEITAFQTDNGVTFGNGRVAFTTPSTTTSVTKTKAIAYLISTNGVPQLK